MKCKECRFYQGSLTGSGMCFRYPPVVVSEFVRREYTEQVEAVTRYPDVPCDEEACGEFNAKGAA